MCIIRVAIDGNNLTVVADIASAWGRHENNYGFFARSFVPFGTGLLRVDVKVVTSPQDRAESVKSFSKDFVGEGNGKHSRYNLVDGNLTIQASMDAVTSNLLPNSGKHGFSDMMNIARDGRVKYWQNCILG